MNTRGPNGLETRAAAEFRAAGRRLEGYAARFGIPAQIGGFTESIRAGAFRASLATPGRDVVCLADHDVTRLLARQSSGTLRLAEDGQGLAFSLDLPDTSVGRDMLELAQRGDLGGCSFGFRVTDEAWPTRDARELRAVDLIEISVVASFPAYSGTSVIPNPSNQDLCAQLRSPMDMIVQGWSTSLFQAAQQWSTRFS